MARTIIYYYRGGAVQGCKGASDLVLALRRRQLDQRAVAERDDRRAVGVHSLRAQHHLITVTI